jgi:2,4-dienoyl-CoA reductase-like NADH-dependent reductase (Old Yellow Enzyme family)/thioredoxin reductase
VALTHVDKPIKIAGAAIKNRVVRTAHATNIGGGKMSDDLIAYHEARARGGVGLSIIEIMAVHPTSVAGLNSFDPTIGEGYRKLVEATRPHGMRLFQQLWHAGHNAHPLDGSPPWSASDVASPTVGIVPVPMTKLMIDEIIAAYVDAARKCESFGLDGVEIHCAHGYLIQQFLSRNANKRSDAYGGSFENRSRFMLEVVRAVRAGVGKDFAVGVRVAPDLTTGGIDADDSARAVQMLEAEQLIDFVNVSLGNYQSFPKMIGGMHEPVGYEMPTSARVTRQVKAPTIVTGRFRTLEEADQVIRAGDADLVGMTRATIADPDLVKKTLEGRATEVRPCIACNQGCVGQLLAPPYRMGCAVNPATGFERQFGDHRIARTETPKKVFVIGGGPAGMEAARVAAMRGHQVILAEAEPSLGGTIKLAARAPTRHGLADITTWLEQEIYRLGVDVRLSSYVEAEDIRREAPDAVIVATGSAPRMDGVQLSNPGEPIDGIDRPNVLSSNELFHSDHKLGNSAVVIDDVGHYEAIAAADYLVSRGLAVTFVSRQTAFGPKVESALMTEPALQRLNRGKFAVVLRSRAIAVDGAGVLIGPTYLPINTNEATHVPADTVVFVSLNKPNREIFDALTGGAIEVRIVGDANAPRFLPIAMREGHLAGAAV